MSKKYKPDLKDKSIDNIEFDTCPVCEQETLDQFGYCHYCLKQVIENPSEIPFDERDY